MVPLKARLGKYRKNSYQLADCQIRMSYNFYWRTEIQNWNRLAWYLLSHSLKNATLFHSVHLDRNFYDIVEQLQQGILQVPFFAMKTFFRTFWNICLNCRTELLFLLSMSRDIHMTECPFTVSGDRDFWTKSNWISDFNN